MNTPTPEQLQEFKDFYVQQITKECGSEKGQLLLRYTDDWWLVAYRNNTAYANHVLMSNQSDVSRKIKIHIETTEECLENFNLPSWAKETIERKLEMLKLAVSELRKLAALQEMVFNLRLGEQSYKNMYDVSKGVVIDLQQQLTEARKEIDKLTFMIENGLGWNDMTNDNTPTA